MAGAGGGRVSGNDVECSEGEGGRGFEREKDGGSEGSESGAAEHLVTSRAFFMCFFIRGYRGTSLIRSWDSENAQRVS